VSRPATCYCLGRIEDGEVAADDLLGCITLYELSAKIPGGDSPTGVQEEHAIVPRLLDRQAI
jgi:hypothetical protein